MDRAGGEWTWLPPGEAARGREGFYQDSVRTGITEPPRSSSCGAHVLLPRRRDIPVQRDVRDHRLPVLLRGVLDEVAEQEVGLLSRLFEV
jgi:hypothetical protein